MREIKFRTWENLDDIKIRVWDIKNKRMKEVMCFYSTEQVEYRDNLSIISLNKRQGDRFVLMRYTGFKDKNKKEIYEGDIVRCNDCSCAVVVWRKDGFALDFLDNAKELPSLWYNAENNEKIEVVGNIYENPELTVLLSDDA